MLASCAVDAIKHTNMNKFVFSQVLSILCLSQHVFPLATYQCGIRQHGFLPLIVNGWQVEEGHWPWHVAVFQRRYSEVFTYGCGGTLVNEKHVLTAAHCVVKKLASNPLPTILYEIELHLGQHNLSKVTDNVVIRDVSKVHVHPNYGPNFNDIAVVVMRLPVEYSDVVISICLDQKVDRDLRELVGQRGWVTGFGKTENGTVAKVLRTASLPVIDFVQCLKDDRVLFGNILNENVFCAGNRNGTSPVQGDSGGGMYISDGDRWILRGIVSFGKFNELKLGIDPFKYTVFVNVQMYLTWIKEVFAESEPRRDRRQKRISELECERFQSLAKKRRNGDCFNRYRHNVMLVERGDRLLCNAVLVEENHVITTCSCIRPGYYIPYPNVKVRIAQYGDRDIAEIVCHPKHADYSKHNDLAILKLKTPVILSNNLMPACLANNWTENLYDILVQTAYVTDALGSWVIEGQLTLVESDENRITLYESCNSLLGPGWYNRSDQIGELCVNNTDQLMYSSFPDLKFSASSGAVLQTSNRRSCMSTIVGLKVHNEKGDEYPTQSWVEVYARVSYHLDWIEQIIWNAQPKVDPQLPFPELDLKCGFYQHDQGIEEWPWSVAIFHRNPNTSAFELTCSGTLISAKHVLTSTQCVVNRTTGSLLPEDAFELHFGPFLLGQRNVKEQIRSVSRVHVYGDYAADDVAILVTSWLVSKTPFVVHICLAPGNNSEFWNLEDPDAFITGWQTIDAGSPNEELRSSNVFILSHQQCSEVSLNLSANQHCTDYPHDDKRSYADRGSGLYHKSLERQFLGTWILVGIVSSQVTGNDVERYTTVVNLQPYLPWIDGIVTERKTKRISERECERFSNLSQKVNGICDNTLSSTDRNPPHIVKLHDDGPDIICLGVLVKEDRILTSCQCIRLPRLPTKVKINDQEPIDILETICHPNYNSSTLNHDVGVVKLATPVEISSHLVPACMANVWTENLEDAMLQTTLFRYLDMTVKPSLRSTYDYIGSASECDLVLPPGSKEHFLRSSQACLVHSDLDTDVFNGSVVQSVDRRACRYTVVGIGSTAVANPALSPVPRIGIVHRVALYLDWIEEVVWGREYEPQQN